MNNSGGKSYVVFKGRVPGIYSSWHECAEQVLGFSHAEHNSYPTYAQALAAWSTYLSKGNNVVASQPSNHGQHHFGVGTSMFTHTRPRLRYGGGATNATAVDTNTMGSMNIGKDVGTPCFYCHTCTYFCGTQFDFQYTATPIRETLQDSQFLLVKKMEKWLVRCCHELQMLNPVFTPEEQRCVDGSLCWRYTVTLPRPLGGRCMLASGVYAHSEAQAREDAAFTMLSQLLEATNMSTCDFNFLRAKYLEERLSKLEREFLDMSMQNASLKQELVLVRGNPCSLYMD